MRGRTRGFAGAAWAVITCAALFSGCEKPTPLSPPPNVPAAARPDRMADLDALWRESVQYRSAHTTMADNTDGLAQDKLRSVRMLDTVSALQRVPVAVDPSADAAAVKAAVLAYAGRLGLSAEVKVSTPPPPTLPGPEVDAAVGLRYESPEVAGFHVVDVTLGGGLEAGPKFVGDLNALGRLFECVGAKIERDGQAVLRGHAPFFRDLKPVQFVRKAPELAGRLAAFTQPTDAEQARIDQIKANLEQVEAVSAQVEKAFAHQAVLKISTARFRIFGELVERYNKASWGAALARGLDAP